MSETTGPESNAPAQESKPEQPTELATRMDRLVASVIDGLIVSLVSLPLVLLIRFIAFFQPTIVTQILAVAVMAGVFLAFNYRLLKENGQTIGKRLVSIQIIGRYGSLLEVNDLLLKRYLPVLGVSIIPFVGYFLALGDVLAIFRESRACIHDDIAGTKVVKS